VPNNISAIDPTPELLSYPEELTADELEVLFTLSEADKTLLAKCRTPPTKLGMAIQLCSLRHFRRFSQSATALPKSAEKYLRLQLGLKKCSLHKYFRDKITQFRHQQTIRDHLGFHELRPSDVIAIGRAVLGRLLVSEESEAVLLELVVNVLLQKQVILPGLTTLERFVRKAKERVRTRLYKQINQRLSKTHRKKLQELLEPPKEDIRTRLEILRSTPTHSSSSNIVNALERVNTIGKYTVSTLKLEDIAENRLRVLIKDGLERFPSL
jgi:Domain of unknown function (DUF4158)